MTDNNQTPQLRIEKMFSQIERIEDYPTPYIEPKHRIWSQHREIDQDGDLVKEVIFTYDTQNTDKRIELERLFQRRTKKIYKKIHKAESELNETALKPPTRKTLETIEKCDKTIRNAHAKRRRLEERYRKRAEKDFNRDFVMIHKEDIEDYDNVSKN